MTRIFKRMSNVVKHNRELLGLSQVKLSQELGYKNGQFISNVERGLCSVPDEKLLTLSLTLKVHIDTLVDAKLIDYRNSLYAVLRCQE